MILSETVCPRRVGTIATQIQDFFHRSFEVTLCFWPSTSKLLSLVYLSILSTIMTKSFSAVLYDGGNANLQVPLLGKQEQEIITPPSISSRSLKMLAFVSGASIALFSQCLLSKLLWDEAILSKSTLQIVLFSLKLELFDVSCCLFQHAAVGDEPSSQLPRRTDPT